MSDQGVCAPWLGHILPWFQPWLQMPIHQALVISVAGWACVLVIIWALPFLSLEFKQQGADRLMSVVHSVLATILGVLAEVCATPACIEGDSWVRGPMMMIIGYLAVDLASMLVCDVWQGWRSVDSSMVLHHVFILAMFGLGVFFDIGVYFAAALLINEASTPFMTLMWYLTFSGRKETPLFLVNGVAFALVFFLCRIVFIPFSFYQFASLNFCSPGGSDWTSMRMRCAPIMAAGYAAIFALNLMWFKKILMGALKKLLQRSDALFSHDDQQLLEDGENGEDEDSCHS